MIEPTADVCLLTPVPLVHLQSGAAMPTVEDLVVFGTNAWEVLRDLQQGIDPEHPVDALFYASEDPAPGSPMATYRARFVEYREARSGKPGKDWKPYRPPSTEQDGAFAGFYAVRGLHRLSSPVEIGKLPKRGGTGLLAHGFVPKGPLVIDTPFPLPGDELPGDEPAGSWEPSVKDFRHALEAAAQMSDDELRAATLGSQGPKSYFIRYKHRVFGLKTIARLVFAQNGRLWGDPSKPQSAKLARMLRPHFEVLHITEETEAQRLERQREMVSRLSRPGQAKFRTDLLNLFSTTCPVSGCSTRDALDAAHIQSVGDDGDDRLENGWILRADLHRLFDAKLMSVHPEAGTLHFSKSCLADYRDFEGKNLKFPPKGPIAATFATHWATFINQQKE
ncbi:HNH endonuclease signature motif containing protein [Novosphingobium resinovorum]|uniref:HNH endonuclease n=1 Tax=Novosphingobium resinovorum TaxID=158500 RepID=UPI002ED63875|nr:HNH endonuclease signature motif containing protein [Novosphingobium resinovorum]